MVDQTNTMGVPLSDSELNDPGSDVDAPDPLLGESAQSGAISKAVPSLASARKNAADRYSENNDEMGDLRSQYAAASKQQSDAYAAEKAQIDAATQRLMGMQVGPSDQEKLYRIAAAQSAPVGNYINSLSGVNKVQADVLQERREAELQKQQLLATYAMQGPQAVIGQTNARLNQLTQQQRIVAGQLNSSGNQQFRGQANLPYNIQQAEDGSLSFKPGAVSIADQIAASKMFGRFTLIPQPDGSKKIVFLGGSGPQIPQSFPPTQPPAPQAPQKPAAAPNPAPPGPQGAAGVAPGGQPPRAPVNPASAAPGASPAPAAPSARSPFDDMFIPSTVLDPKYGALTQATKPAYVATAQQAFDPAYFQGYQWHPTVIGDDKIRAKQIEKMSEDQAQAAQGAEQTIYNYGSALSSMDQLDDPALRTGPAGIKINAFENTLRGVLPDNVTKQIFNDPDLQKLATSQETDKYFLNAATSGLKAIYGGRITNMEVQQRLKSLPSNNLLPAVTKMLASAQAEVAQDTVNKAKVWSVYKAKNGDPDPARFNTFYQANFNPFGASKLQQNLAAQKGIAANRGAPVQPTPAQSPLVQYYVALGKWKAAGSQGPAPVKPQ